VPRRSDLHSPAQLWQTRGMKRIQLPTGSNERVRTIFSFLLGAILGLLVHSAF